MRKVVFGLYVCLLSAALYAGNDFRTATADELAIKDASWSRGASAVLLDWDVRHDDQDPRAIEYVRFKVLTEEAKSTATSSCSRSRRAVRFVASGRARSRLTARSRSSGERSTTRWSSGAAACG